MWNSKSHNDTPQLPEQWVADSRALQVSHGGGFDGYPEPIIYNTAPVCLLCCPVLAGTIVPAHLPSAHLQAGQPTAALPQLHFSMGTTASSFN